MSNTTHWNPAAILDESKRTDSSSPFAVIVLNQPIRNVTVFLSICARAEMIIAVDGGANRIKDLYLNETRLKICMPRAIVGDLDSLRDDVRTYFVERDVSIKYNPDQDSTDFGKGLEYIEQARRDLATSAQSEPPPLDIVAFSGLGGRADHAFAQLSQLYKANSSRTLDQGRLFLFTAESLMFVLSRGHNTIAAPQTPKTFDQSVGIVPVGRPAVITTKGLEWDVRNWETEFETQVSTSNHIRADTVEVESSERVLFTMELALKPSP